MDTSDTSRWLLPFTHGVDMGAIDLVVDLAERAGATLIAVSLISEPRMPRSGGVRMEHIMQSKDFLEAVHWRADRYSVPVERYESFTADVMQSISLLVDDLHCDAIMLVTTGDREVFLQTHELKSLLERPPSQLLIIRMSVPPENAQPGSRVRRFLSWLHRLRGSGSQNADVSLGQSDVPEAEEPCWIRTEGCQQR
jgi:hypothetical protein